MKQSNKKINLLLYGSIGILLLEIILISLASIFFYLKSKLGTYDDSSKEINYSIVTKYYEILITTIVLLVLFCIGNLIISTTIWASKWENNFSKRYALLFGILSSCLICGIGTLIFSVISKYDLKKMNELILLS